MKGLNKTLLFIFMALGAVVLKVGGMG